MKIPNGVSIISLTIIFKLNEPRYRWKCTSFNYFRTKCKLNRSCTDSKTFSNLAATFRIIEVKEFLKLLDLFRNFYFSWNFSISENTRKGQILIRDSNYSKDPYFMFTFGCFPTKWSVDQNELFESKDLLVPNESIDCFVRLTEKNQKICWKESTIYQVNWFIHWIESKDLLLDSI